MSSQMFVKPVGEPEDVQHHRRPWRPKHIQQEDGANNPSPKNKSLHPCLLSSHGFGNLRSFSAIVFRTLARPVMS